MRSVTIWAQVSRVGHEMVCQNQFSYEVDANTLGYAARPTEPKTLAPSNSFGVETEGSVDLSGRQIYRAEDDAEIETHVQIGEECAKAERVEQ
eukprot:2905724-Amphidinium_carterae.2